MKKISILGSTGSIGKQTLNFVREHPNDFRVIALAVNRSVDTLKEQIEEFKPEFVAVYDEAVADSLQTDVTVYKGMQGLMRVATDMRIDTVVNSLVGSIGVLPTYQAIKASRNVALANKETLVTAGKIIMEAVDQYKVSLMPIDSEHSAIYQCLNGRDSRDVNQVYITCSGGPFMDRYDLDKVTAADALKHPTWTMGKKITIDSATLMNKGFEVIEAHFLFNIPYDRIKVVIHPQSIMHSCVEFVDGSVIAQMGLPDMRIPIQYALTAPQRYANQAKRLDLVKDGPIEFREYDVSRFPCLDYAYEAGRTGGTMPAVMNAANEIAVQLFLQDKIKFTDIARIIREEMDKHKLVKNPELDEMLDIDKRVKENVRNQYG